MTESTSRGPYAKSAAVRQRILDACIDAFGDAGFYGATMKDIASRAGISHTGLLHHFSRKEDLLLAVLEARAERSTKLLNPSLMTDPRSDPVKALNGMLEVIVDNELRPGLLELHCVVSGEATSPDHPAHEHYAQRYRELREFYRQAFEALQLRGDLHSTIEPSTLATMTISLINGLQTQWLFDRESVNMEQALRQFFVSIVPNFNV